MATEFEYEQLERLGSLREKGHLSEKEFQVAKARVLNTREHSKSSSVDSEPEIWNPSAAVNWSLIFSPLFGIYIHSQNWKTLGEKKRAGAAIVWFVGTIVVGCWSAIFFESSVRSGQILFWYLVLWFFVSGKRQINFVNEKFGKNYKKKSWTLPLFIGVVFLLIILASQGQPN